MTEKIINKTINNEFDQVEKHPGISIVKSNSIENLNTEKSLNTKEYVNELVKLLIRKNFECLCQNH